MLKAYRFIDVDPRAPVRIAGHCHIEQRSVVVSCGGERMAGCKVRVHQG